MERRGERSREGEQRRKRKEERIEFKVEMPRLATEGRKLSGPPPRFLFNLMFLALLAVPHGGALKIPITRGLSNHFLSKVCPCGGCQINQRNRCATVFWTHMVHSKG